MGRFVGHQSSINASPLDRSMSSLLLDALPRRASGAVVIPRADAIARVGRFAVGLAIVAFGVANFVVGDFVAGRAPAWPVHLPGQLAWAYLTGAVLVGAGLCILTGRHAARAAMVVAGLVGAWAFARQLPIAFAEDQLGGEWTRLGKALAFSGGMVGVAASFLLASPLTDAELDRAWRLRAIGRASLGAFLTTSGIQHFLFTPFVVTLVPAWIPQPTFWTYLAGSALVAGGLGLVNAATSRLAATMVGFMVATWFVVLHVPRAMTINTQNEWTAMIEALCVSGLAFALVQRAR